MAGKRGGKPGASSRGNENRAALNDLLSYLESLGISKAAFAVENIHSVLAKNILVELGESGHFSVSVMGEFFKIEGGRRSVPTIALHELFLISPLTSIEHEFLGIQPLRTHVPPKPCSSQIPTLAPREAAQRAPRTSTGATANNK